MIYVGDCLETMRGLPSGAVQTCVTSPPYFGLRDYGHEGQIGLEATPDEFVGRLVEVFREVRRLLRDDGTLWLNLGDSYAAQGGGQVAQSKWQVEGASDGQNAGHARKPPSGFKPKDLIGIPWMVAFALRADGWYLRQDIIWHKPNPMPESVRDRCTKAHEYLFLLSKSPRYYFDHKSVEEEAVGGTPGNKRATKGGRAYEEGAAEHRTAANLHNIGARETRNKRSVWTVTAKPFKGAHFATFPETLVQPCVLAGCPEGGTVLDPFMGAGTTAVVCERLARKWIGCELNPAYAEIAEARIRAVQPALFGSAA